MDAVCRCCRLEEEELLYLLVHCPAFYRIRLLMVSALKAPTTKGKYQQKRTKKGERCAILAEFKHKIQMTNFVQHEHIYNHQSLVKADTVKSIMVNLTVLW